VVFAQQSRGEGVAELVRRHRHRPSRQLLHREVYRGARPPFAHCDHHRPARSGVAMVAWSGGDPSAGPWSSGQGLRAQGRLLAPA
jgi:hypothetical protein